ncbi:S8 family peptidase [Crocinitomix sp.]|nr:S8 family peptidase [Crocinitomix sp.]
MLGTTTYDTIWADGNLISPVEFYAEEINGVYHIEMVMLSPDSADYYFRFETTGNGEYDLWSGAWLGASDIVFDGLPDFLDFPDIAHYILPDSLSTIVSSWTCSPNVVTVGNFKNQYDYIDYLGEPYIVAGGPPGELSPNSSKGPNRQGIIKPDVSATGDGIMSACPLWLSASLVVSNPSMLAEGGQHVRNGGTSMASPVIAGIAALYLEKCPNATYQEFLEDLHSLAYEDLFTGITPNMGYGYGKVNAFQLLTETNFPATLLGDTLICDEPEVYSFLESPFEQYLWFNGETSSELILDETTAVYATVINDRGCKSYSDMIAVIKGTLPLFPTINEIGGGLITTPAAHYIWYIDGEPIAGSDAQFFDPDTTGMYTVQVFSEEGCSYFSDEIYIDLSQIDEMNKNDFILFPNPFSETIHIIKGDNSDLTILITDISGKEVYSNNTITVDQTFIPINLSHVERGIYLINLFYDDSFMSYKVVKQ